MGRKPPQDGSNNLRVSCPKGRQDDAARHDNRVILCLAFETDEKALRRILYPGRSPMRPEPEFSSTTARRGWRWAGPVASRPSTRWHRYRDRPRLAGC